MVIIEMMLGLFLSVVFAWFFYRAFSQPSHDRAWVQFHKELPYGEYQQDGTVVLHNLRSARYRSETDYDVSYSDSAIDPKELARVWFVIEPYKPGQAHTFLSFEFSDGRYVAASVEVRKTSQKSFKAWMVAVRNFEIFYVLADEQDVLYLRTNIRKDPVMLYPLRLSPEEAHCVLTGVIDEMNAFYRKPMFYRIFSRNCTSVPMRNVGKGSSKIPKFDWRYIITSRSDELLYNVGLIDVDAPLSVVQERYNITERAQKLLCDGSFSKRVRE
jgi:hypothetical protein